MFKRRCHLPLQQRRSSHTRHLQIQLNAFKHQTTLTLSKEKQNACFHSQACPYSQLTLTLSHPNKNLKGIFQACNVGLGIDRITFWYKWLIPPRTLHTILMVLCPSFNLFFPMALFCSSLQNWVSHLQPLLHFWSISFWIKFVCLYFSLSFFSFQTLFSFFF